MKLNPDKELSVPKKSFHIKNWLILGAAGFGGYYLWKNVIKKQLDSPSSLLKSALSKGGSGPDVNGPMVSQFKIVSTQTPNCTSTQVPGFAYSPITSVNQFTGYKTFTATATGHFTRRLLCKGNQQWAEINPGI